MNIAEITQDGCVFVITQKPNWIERVLRKGGKITKHKINIKDSIPKRQKVSIYGMGFMGLETYYGEFIAETKDGRYAIDLVQRCPLHGQVVIVNKDCVKEIK